MSAVFFYRHRVKFAAFFYFVGSIQIINYLAAKLVPSLPFLSYVIYSAGALFSFLWEAVLGIGSGMLFLAVGWLMTSMPNPPKTGQPRAEPKVEPQTQQLNESRTHENG